MYQKWPFSSPQKWHSSNSYPPVEPRWRFPCVWGSVSCVYLCGGFIALAYYVERNVCLGGLQNGYRKTQCLQAHNTTHNPQPTTHNPQPTTHNPQHQDEPQPPYPPAALPSLSMGRAAAPPNLGTATPHGSTASTRWRVCDRRGWFSCLGHQKATHQKIERGTGSQP